MAHDRFVCVRTIFGSIGVGEALKGVAVAGFDGIQPGLFDWKAKTGVIKSNQGANAGQIKAVRIEGSTKSSGSQGNSLGCCTIEVEYRAGSPGSVSSWKQKHVSWSVSSTIFVSSGYGSRLLTARAEVVGGLTAAADAMPYRRPRVRLPR